MNEFVMKYVSLLGGNEKNIIYGEYGDRLYLLDITTNNFREVDNINQLDVILEDIDIEEPIVIKKMFLEIMETYLLQEDNQELRNKFNIENLTLKIL